MSHDPDVVQEDFDLSDRLIDILTEHRGGCHCHSSPPCAAHSDPLTYSEMVELGWKLHRTRVTGSWMIVTEDDSIFDELPWPGNVLPSTPPKDVKKGYEPDRFTSDIMSVTKRMFQ
jgi:hypothetical protein